MLFLQRFAHIILAGLFLMFTALAWKNINAARRPFLTGFGLAWAAYGVAVAWNYQWLKGIALTLAAVTVVALLVVDWRTQVRKQ
jgi:hypothetical protein